MLLAAEEKVAGENGYESETTNGTPGQLISSHFLLAFKKTNYGVFTKSTTYFVV